VAIFEFDQSRRQTRLDPACEHRRGRLEVNTIQRIFDRRKVWRSLRDYPVYAPPFTYGKDWKTAPSRAQIEQNYKYFREEKAGRLRYLAGYLASYSVELRLKPDALPALGRWLYRYGGYLDPGGGDVILALSRYQPAWVDKFRGLNVMNDIAIFAGDYIVSKNKNTRWDAWYGNGSKRAYEMIGFGQPCILGSHDAGYQGHHSILDEIYNCCAAGHARWRRGRISPTQPWDNPGEFERLLSYLADASAPPPIPFSQLIMDKTDHNLGPRRSRGSSDDSDNKR
jgi:hypothetical protein